MVEQIWGGLPISDIEEVVYELIDVHNNHNDGSPIWKNKQISWSVPGFTSHDFTHTHTSGISEKKRRKWWNMSKSSKHWCQSSNFSGVAGLKSRALVCSHESWSLIDAIFWCIRMIPIYTLPKTPSFTWKELPSTKRKSNLPSRSLKHPSFKSFLGAPTGPVTHFWRLWKCFLKGWPRRPASVSETIKAGGVRRPKEFGRYTGLFGRALLMYDYLFGSRM